MKFIARPQEDPSLSGEANIRQRMEGLRESVENMLRVQAAYKLHMDVEWEKLQRAKLQVEIEFGSFQNRQSDGVSVSGINSPICEGDLPSGDINSSTHEGNLPKDGDTNNLAVFRQQIASIETPGEDKFMKFSVSNDVDNFESFEIDSSSWVDDAEEPDAAWMVRRWLRSPKFDMLVGFVIVANMFVIMARIQYEGLLYRPGGGRSRVSGLDSFLDVSEHLFTLMFLVELLLRLFANGHRHLCHLSEALDALIVVGSCLDSWVLPAVTDGGGTKSLGMLRIFRLLRLVKVLRVVRIMGAFAPLRVLVQAVFSSLGALVWSMMLLFVLEIIGAIILAQSLQAVIKDEERNLQMRQNLWKSFGTMARAWLSCFEITMAPGSFLQYRFLYDEVSPLFTFGIAVYVCFVTFAVTRVITAMFLKETLEASSKEARFEESRIKARRLAYSNFLCERLEEIEGEGPGQGRIDKQGMASLLRHKRMSEWLDDADLSAKEAERLFKALDLGDGSVFLSEFMACISQICDHQKDKEYILHQESAKILNILIAMTKQNQIPGSDAVVQV